MDADKLKEVTAKLTDAERAELAAKLDAELDERMRELENSGSKYMDGWSPENWQEEMEKHPFFTSKIDPEQTELSPLLKGIQDLKYSPDENTPEELAKNYKEDGNFNFKCGKYRFAVASYSEGLKHKCSDEVLNTQLLTNRAASQYHIHNYRSALIDCRLALAKTPDHMKALIRAAQCCLKLDRFDEGKEMCDRGLEIDPKDKTLLALRTELVKKEKEKERDRRRRERDEKMKKSIERKLLDAIAQRGIRMDRKHGAKSDLSLEDLEPCHPSAVRKMVHFSSEDPNVLVWPTLFLYPEFGETDFIEEFSEIHRFCDHMEVMFSEPAPWDAKKDYSLDRLRVYYEDKEKVKLVEVDAALTLGEVLKDERYKVYGGTPAFIILSKGNDFSKDFLKKYQ